MMDVKNKKEYQISQIDNNLLVAQDTWLVYLIRGRSKKYSHPFVLIEKPLTALPSLTAVTLSFTRNDPYNGILFKKDFLNWTELLDSALFRYKKPGFCYYVHGAQRNTVENFFLEFKNESAITISPYFKIPSWLWSYPTDISIASWVMEMLTKLKMPLSRFELLRFANYGLQKNTYLPSLKDMSLRKDLLTKEQIEFLGEMVTPVKSLEPENATVEELLEIRETDIRNLEESIVSVNEVLNSLKIFVPENFTQHDQIKKQPENALPREEAENLTLLNDQTVAQLKWRPVHADDGNPFLFFNELNNLSLYSGELNRENTWATDEGIYQCLEYYLKDIAFVMNPALFSVTTLFDTDTQKARTAMQNCLQEIVGHISQDGKLVANGYIKKDSLLDKPIVIIINTQAAKAKNSKDTEAEDGSHWVAIIILPQNYHPLNGEPLNNPNELIYYIDSLNQYLLPSIFAEGILQGLACDETSDKSPIQHIEELHSYIRLIPAAFPNAQFVTEPVLQQKGGSDCGWWVVYNALMFVLTGNTAFLEPFKKREPERAFHLRHLLGNLALRQEPNAMQVDTDSRESMSEEIQVSDEVVSVLVNLNSQVEILLQEKEQLQQTMEKLKAQYAHSERVLKEKEIENVQLRQDNERLQDDKHFLSEQIVALKEAMRDLNKQIEERDSTIEQLRRTVEKQQRDLEIYTAKTEKRFESYDSLFGEFQRKLNFFGSQIPNQTPSHSQPLSSQNAPSSTPSKSSNQSGRGK